jgi:rubrerythrin
MTLDLTQTLDRIHARQWVLADIDWDAPGADRITPAQFEPLKRFMTDLVWIEQIGARGFAGLAHQAPDPTLAEIYRYFHAEEQRHANAELALMRRWGMLDDGRVPEANINVRLAMGWLDANADHLPLEALGTVIPMLEVALDGALVKFLLDEVHDPLCHEVFDRINNDESRHLAVGFHVLEVLGAEHVPRSRLRARIDALRPSTLVGGIVSLPLFARIGRGVEAMGLDKQRLLRSLGRFHTVGDRSPVVRRNPAYRALSARTKGVVEQGPAYEWFADLMLTLSDYYPRMLLSPIPAWIGELTCEPTS